MAVAQTISMQLWSGRNSPTIDNRYEELVEMGYDAVEPYTVLFESDPVAYRRKLDAVGLSCPSVHFELHDIQADPDRWFDMADTLGAKNIVVPHLRKTDPLSSIGDWRKLGEDLQAVYELGKHRGFTVAWSNHGIEYPTLSDGRRPIDHLLDSPDVSYELVLGWLHRAGQDPASELQRYDSRIHTLRLSDNGDPDQEADGGWTAVGDGRVGYENLWQQILELPNLTTVIVDHPGPDDYLTFARRSIAAIRAGLSSQ